MGGRPVSELDGQTTIEAQNTPALDRVAATGETGLMFPIAPGVPAGSDTAHMAILGYDPYQYYRGRGPFEARGVGIDVRPGDVAFRCNFSTVEGRKVVDRRAGRIKEGTDRLAAAINEQLPTIEDVQIIFKPSVEHRAALVLRGPGLSHEISEVDPHETGVDYWECEPLPDAADPEAAAKTAHIVNEFVRRCHEIMDAHEVNVQRRKEGKLPANIALPRGAGTAVELQPFEEHYGLRGAMIVEVDLVRGLGEYLSMDVIHVDGATGGQDTDEIAIAEAVIAALDDHDFVLANIKCPDLGGHDGNCAAKMEAIAKVDRAVGHILDRVDMEQTTLMISADHCTPCAVEDHSGDAVPIAVCGRGVRPDDVQAYGERMVYKGSLGHLRGMELMKVMTNYMGAAHKFGA
ncbi:MAG: 2,3-bisphosphoglycerate-independent phosphoglycerate mutase [Armatimonadetes bacterium]|nr:2,3-bisphosphoglycerate-independent phosphoglycerate mutase [Armatimonadota bacterium]